MVSVNARVLSKALATRFDVCFYPLLLSIIKNPI